MYFNRCYNFRDRNTIDKGAEKILKYKDLTIEISVHVVYKNKRDTSNNMGNWNHHKILNTLETRFFQVYNCKIPHKGDNKEDNDYDDDDDDDNNNNNNNNNFAIITFFHSIHNLEMPLKLPISLLLPIFSLLLLYI